jgi:magnesium chelatase family protein
LDSLRQPLESGQTIIARANHRIAYPSRFQLIAAMNPCKCGGSPGQSCRSGPSCAATYQGRISGPFMDRIDLHIEVPAVTAADLCLPAPSEGSAEVGARVTAARDIQRRRFEVLAKNGPPGTATGMRTNADCDGRLLEEIAMPEGDGLALLTSAAQSMNLSARGFHRTLRVARTISDLDGVETVGRVHIAEALSYRAEALRLAQAA